MNKPQVSFEVEHWRKQVADLQDNTETVVVDNTGTVPVAVDNTGTVLLAVGNTETVLLVVGNTEIVLLVVGNTEIAEDTAVVGVPSDIED